MSACMFMTNLNGKTEVEIEDIKKRCIQIMSLPYDSTNAFESDRYYGNEYTLMCIYNRGLRELLTPAMEKLEEALNYFRREGL